MATFNKILNPVYSTISGFTMNSDGSMNVTYAIGTGTEEAEQITEFRPLVTEYKYLDSTQAHAICSPRSHRVILANRSKI